MKIHKRFIAVVFVLLCAPVLPVVAAAPAGVLIVELQTAGATSSEKFVEVYNTSAAAVDVSGWQLQYRSAAATKPTDWKTRSTVSCANNTCTVLLPSHSRLLFASYDVPGVDGEQTFSASGAFSVSGGQIQLVDAVGTVQDSVVYGNGTIAGERAVPAPVAGQSVVRRVSAAGSFIATGDASLDFTATCGVPTPGDLRVPVAGTAEGCPLFELPTVPAPEETPPPLPSEDSAPDQAPAPDAPPNDPVENPALPQEP